MTKLTNFIAIFLLSLLIFQSVGFLMIFSIQQQVIRNQIKQQIIDGIPDHELVVIKIPFETELSQSTTFKWIKKNEFRYYGMMYDIVRKKVVDKVTWYYCLEDKKEKLLYDRQEKNKDDLANVPTKNNKTSILVHILISFYDIKHEKLIHNPLITESFSSIYLFGVKTWVFAPPFPPPKV